MTLGVAASWSVDLSPRPFGKNESDCEPVHICSAWCLLGSNGWGILGAQ